MRDRVTSHLHGCIKCLQLTNQMKGIWIPSTVFQCIFFCDYRRMFPGKFADAEKCNERATILPWVF